MALGKSEHGRAGDFAPCPAVKPGLHCSIRLLNCNLMPRVFPLRAMVWGGMALVVVMAGAARAQTLMDIGQAAPTPGTNDICQLSTSGNQTWPDGINYFTDNNPPVGQTFTTGSTALNLVSVAIKTAGLNNGNGYGTPSSTPTYYLRIYSMSGSTATLLNMFQRAESRFHRWRLAAMERVERAAGSEQNLRIFFRHPADRRRLGGAGCGHERLRWRRNRRSFPSAAARSRPAAATDLMRYSILVCSPTNSPAVTPWPMPTIGMNLGNTLELGGSPPNQALF